MRNCCQTHLTLLILDPSFVGCCLLKDQPILFSLTDIYFHSTLFREKDIRRNLSQYFSFVLKIGCKQGATLVGANYSSQMLIVCHFLENKVQ